MEEKKSRIIIRDLSKDEKIDREQMKRIIGGVKNLSYRQPQPGEPGYPPSPFPKGPGPWVYW